MNLAGAIFIGGPAHGEIREMETGPDGNPPSEVQAYLPPPLHAVLPAYEADPATTLQNRTVTYRREVNPADDGPLWRYMEVPS